MQKQSVGRDTPAVAKRHLHRVESALSRMPQEETLTRVATRFKLLGEVNRLKILLILSIGEQCVEHLVEGVGGTQSNVSHQLRLLKDAGFVSARKAGKNVLYSLKDAHVKSLLTAGLSHADCGVEE